jgi:aryl carrier-like protein
MALDKEQVLGQISELLDMDVHTLDWSGDLTDFGMDSIRVMTLIEQWRAAGVPVDFLEVASAPTVRNWLTLLALGDEPEESA